MAAFLSLASTTSLDPCPFCSSRQPILQKRKKTFSVDPHLYQQVHVDKERYHTISSQQNADIYYVECSTCGSRTGPCSTEEGAKKTWNCRTE